MDIDAVLAAHDAQVRRSLVAAPGFTIEDTGRVVRLTAPPGSEHSHVEWSDLDETTADAEIAAQVAHFGDRPFEWKTYGRDRPADLGERLTAAGFEAGAPEAFVVGELADVLAATAGHDGVEGVDIRDATDDDLDRMTALSESVWGRSNRSRLDELFAERAHDPRLLTILVAVAGDDIISSGWIHLPDGVDFASLWGGSTDAAWRGRGIYRALVRRRALLAARTGHRWLQVDCSDDSRPILERLGMRTIDTTTPYRFTPRGPEPA